MNGVIGRAERERPGKLAVARVQRKDALAISRRDNHQVFPGQVGHQIAKQMFFALVRVGTPVSIATTQSEDETIGPKVRRVDDSKLPDPDPHIMVSDAAFSKPSGPLLE